MIFLSSLWPCRDGRRQPRWKNAPLAEVPQSRWQSLTGHLKSHLGDLTRDLNRPASSSPLSLWPRKVILWLSLVFSSPYRLEQCIPSDPVVWVSAQPWITLNENHTALTASSPFSWTEKRLVTLFFLFSVFLSYFSFLFFSCKIRHSFEFVCVLKYRTAGHQEC